MFLWYTGGIHHFFTLRPVLNLPEPSNRTLPWTWGSIVPRCSPSWASARSACPCGSGSWSRPRCGSGSAFPPRCGSGSWCLPRCGSGSSVLPRRWRWSQKPCGTASAWSCWQRALQEEPFINAFHEHLSLMPSINALLHGCGRKPLPVTEIFAEKSFP